MDGVIVVDKPSEWTSHDVVNKMRRWAGTKKVGHLGTLDPAATGVLPLVIGRATRLAQFYTKNDKTYEGVIHFGYTTDSYDADGEPTSPVCDVAPSRDELEAALAKFRGPISQIPPAVSAKKIGGRPAYELARKNIAVELKPVDIDIYSLDLVTLNGPEATIRVHCSSGTYIRSIAHDVGQALGCGAHLKSLRRIQSGDFRIEQAHTLKEIERASLEKRFDDLMIPAGRLLPDFPSEQIDQATETQIRHGRAFHTSPFGPVGTARYVKAVNSSGALVAIGEARMPNLYHPVLVL